MFDFPLAIGSPNRQIPPVKSITGLSIFVLLILTACAQVRQARAPLSILDPWSYSDLRAVGSTDGIDPAQDVVALYTRRIPAGLQLRLDMLDQAAENDTDLYIAIDNTGGGSLALPWGETSVLAWDILIRIPAHGDIQILDDKLEPQSGTSVTVLRDPSQDTISISLIQAHSGGFRSQDQPLSLSPGARIQVFSSPAGRGLPVASLGPVAVHGFPPPPAPVLLAFWNTLPAYTPAQSLRRWDGAHTGPLGGRHGLRNLLKASRDYSIPLTLLDLKSPASLSALDFLDGTAVVKKMAAEGLLDLPDVIPTGLGSPLPALPDWALRTSAAESRQIGLDFGLPASQFLFAPWQVGLPEGYPFTFALVDSSKLDSKFPLQTYLSSASGRTILPIPNGVTLTQATLDGPSIEIRKALVQTALSAEGTYSLGRSPILVLGGDLPRSTWGIPQAASATMRYLRAHPWIKLIDTYDLQSARSSLTFQPSNPEANSQNVQELLARIGQTSISDRRSDTVISDDARQMFLSLYSPLSPTPIGLSNLRNQYLAQEGTLLAASRWSAHPVSISDCSQDADEDGKAECILASSEIFTIFDSDTGALTYAFVRSQDGFHQIIAPSSQFITGLSDPSTWQLERGLKADPNTVPGAFSNLGPFVARAGPTQITFNNPDISKTYRLLQGSIQISIHSKTPLPSRIPLAIDPWQRFEPGWAERYQGSNNGETWSWGIISGFQVQVSGLSTASSLQSFEDSQNLITGSENPNIDYPAGYYLPFPMALINIPPEKDVELSINWTP